MKYTLNTYGWSGEFIGKSLIKEQTKQIELLKEDRKVDELWEIRFDIDDEMDFDIWDGDLLHVNKPLNNGTILFEVIDSHGDVVLEFGIEDIQPSEDDVESYEVFPTDDVDVFFTIDENKGGFCSYDFESDDIPTVGDFGYTQTTVDTPQTYWDIINDFTFKGDVMEVYDHLDSVGKSSEVFIFKKEPVIKYNPNLCACHPDNGGDGTCQCD
jgi:hypothetical protein